MQRIVLIFLLAFLLAPGSASPEEAASAPMVMTVTVADPIGPGVAEFMEDAIETAEERRATCLIVLLDTPGGAVESMRGMVQAIFTSQVPVVVFVSPSGARAASAGVMITMAADIAAMAPGTTIGAAHPVGAGGKDIDGKMAEKALNDMVAFARGVARRHGRNEQWAEQAVRESVSITAQEAVDTGVVDLIAKDLDALIALLDGRKLEGRGTLQLSDAVVEAIEPSLRTRILKVISDPNIAYILLMIGLAGLYFELSQPGAVLPGVIGAIALILAFFSFQTLPVNIAGILLILLAVIFFILELKITSFGMLSVAGVVSMVLGSLMLFKGAGPQTRVAWQVVVPTLVMVSGFFIGVVTLVVRAHARKAHTGSEGLIGEIGVVKQVNGTEGKVLVHGEVWQARFQGEAAVGDKVAVVSVEGLVVVVQGIGTSLLR